MAQKHCYFKDCTSRADQSGRTLFNFPYRDAERLFRWLELTGCTKQELERKPRHVCDLHFDPKYFAICQRRKVLVGKALPELNRVYYATSTGSAAADTTGHPLTEEEGDGEEEEHSLIIREDVLDEEEDDEVDEIVVDEIESLKYEEDQLESLERIDAEAEEVPPEEEQEIVKKGKAVGPGKSAHLERIPEKRPIPSSPEISSRNPIASRTFSNKKPKIEKQGLFVYVSVLKYYLIH